MFKTNREVYQAAEWLWETCPHLLAEDGRDIGVLLEGEIVPYKQYFTLERLNTHKMDGTGRVIKYSVASRSWSETIASSQFRKDRIEISQEAEEVFSSFYNKAKLQQKLRKDLNGTNDK